MKPETALVRRLMLAATERGARLLRNNVGDAWQGRATVAHARTTVTLERGDVVIRNARRVSYGLCVGSSDLIGWTPVTITPEMVGRTVAVFTAVEAKTLRGRPTDAQIQFVHAVQAAGGLAAIARSTDDLPDGSTLAATDAHGRHAAR